MIDLKTERTKANLTMKELAETIGVDKSYISRLESGKRDIRSISLLKAKKLCECLQIPSVKELL